MAYPIKRFAPVAPPEVLHKMKENLILGTYHLLLAHDVAGNPAKYRDLFLPSDFIIMDNSVIELGTPVDATTMKAACNVVIPSVVVLPDVIGDFKQTVQLAERYLDQWASTGLGPFMAVPQGQSENEIYACIDTYLRMPHIKAFGVPRACVKPLGSRKPVIEYLNRVASDKHIHLLGFSDNLQDDILCTRLPGVSGIDSAVPIRLGVKGTLMDVNDDASQYPPRGDFWDTARDITPEVINNVQKFRIWINQ